MIAVLKTKSIFVVIRLKELIFTQTFEMFLSRFTRIICLLICYQSVIAWSDAEKGSPEVTISSGKAQGSWKTSYDGREYAAFEGIPYAEPPIGDLRFEVAKPMGRWSGVMRTTQLYECIQFNYPLETIGQEDCLYINVYVPKKTNISKTLDVVVHIHGGGFMYGSGNTFVEPKYVMDRDIVLVTFNYRLGVFGFISTGDDVAPGNNALRDQVLALKWIQENIAHFGGNPKSVTLTGFSAGAACVHHHYFSSMSEGLFHRGMTISGVSLSPWAIQNDIPEKTKTLGKIVGCPTSTSQSLIDCLKTRPARLLTIKTMEFASGPGRAFGPVVEKEAKNSFLAEHPYNMLLKGNVSDLPLIASVTTDEGLYLVPFYTEKDMTDDGLTDILFLKDVVQPADKNDVLNKIRKFYLGKNKTFKTIGDLVRVISDRYFITDTDTAVRLQSAVTKSPVYSYYFNYNKGENMIKNPMLAPPVFKGTSHGDDMIYIFGAMIDNKLSQSDIRMKDLSLDMLYSYASTGIPVFKNVTWLPNHGSKISYLNITDPEDIKLEVKKHLLPSYQFWKSLGLLEQDKLVEKK